MNKLKFQSKGIYRGSLFESIKPLRINNSKLNETPTDVNLNLNLKNSQNRLDTFNRNWWFADLKSTNSRNFLFLEKTKKLKYNNLFKPQTTQITIIQIHDILKDSPDGLLYLSAKNLWIFYQTIKQSHPNLLSKDLFHRFLSAYSKDFYHNPATIRDLSNPTDTTKFITESSLKIFIDLKEFGFFPDSKTYTLLYLILRRNKKDLWSTHRYIMDQILTEKQSKTLKFSDIYSEPTIRTLLMLLSSPNTTHHPKTFSDLQKFKTLFTDLKVAHIPLTLHLGIGFIRAFQPFGQTSIPQINKIHQVLLQREAKMPWNRHVFDALIEAYAEVGSHDAVRRLVERMKGCGFSLSTENYSGLLGTYQFQDNKPPNNVFHWFTLMNQKQIQKDDRIYSVVLKACLVMNDRKTVKIISSQLDSYFKATKDEAFESLINFEIVKNDILKQRLDFQNHRYQIESAGLLEKESETVVDTSLSMTVGRGRKRKNIQTNNTTAITNEDTDILTNQMELSVEHQEKIIALSKSKILKLATPKSLVGVIKTLCEMGELKGALLAFKKWKVVEEWLQTVYVKRREFFLELTSRGKSNSNLLEEEEKKTESKKTDITNSIKKKVIVVPPKSRNRKKYREIKRKIAKKETQLANDIKKEEEPDYEEIKINKTNNTDMRIRRFTVPLPSTLATLTKTFALRGDFEASRLFFKDEVFSPSVIHYHWHTLVSQMHKKQRIKYKRLERELAETQNPKKRFLNLRKHLFVERFESCKKEMKNLQRDLDNGSIVDSSKVGINGPFRFIYENFAEGFAERVKCHFNQAEGDDGEVLDFETVNFFFERFGVVGDGEGFEGRSKMDVLLKMDDFIKELTELELRAVKSYLCQRSVFEDGSS